MRDMEIQERALWTKFEIGLKQLNRNQVAIDQRFASLSAAVNFAVKNRVAGLAESRLMDMQERGARIKAAISALNNAYNLTQMQSAFTVASSEYPGDFDILANQDLPQQMIEASTFDRQFLPVHQELGIWPLVLKGAILLGMAIIVKGVVDAVTDTIESQNAYNKDIQHAQTDAETTFSKDPKIFKMWTDYKRAISGIKPGLFEKFTEGAGSIALVGIALVVGYFVFQQVRKSK